MRQVLWSKMMITLVFFCLDKIDKFCRESLVKTIVSLKGIFLDRLLHIVVECNSILIFYDLIIANKLLNI